MGHASHQIFKHATPHSGSPKGDIAGGATTGKGTKSRLHKKLVGGKPPGSPTLYPNMNPAPMSENSLDLSQLGLGVGPNTKGVY